MRLDGHIHTGLEKSEYIVDPARNQKDLMERLSKAGLDGGVILSVDPLKFADWDPERRLQDCLDTCKGQEHLYPFYYLNPLESDALDQIDMAAKAGVYGFKMICTLYAPSDERCLRACERIAQVGKPVLFHSGICWDGVNSCNNNRPGNFEALIEIPHLKFCLAHISWPWYDECIAVYGKFNNAYYRRPEMSCEMFIDVTPGTPRRHREDAFRHLLTCDYELRYNLIFGTDCNTSKYNTSWAVEWQQRDDALYEKYCDGDVEDFKEHVYCRNILRFIGVSDEKPEKAIPMVGE
ncbi:MAG: hypothetical protein IIY46_02640 [Lachnospiraceae bacterium]|nr:hypothetical protein [Lachnospiraceae bacterium]MBQ6544622.1 hypothetical protein [Lachnospiraceae bacterium]